MKIMVFILSVLVLLSCSPKSESPQKLLEPPTSSVNAPDSTLAVYRSLPYDFESFSQVYNLDSKLLEISGLDYDATEDRFLAVNDEKGYLYLLSSSDMSIQKEIDFGGNGDYEGVELINEIAYMVKSSGKIYTYNIVGDIDGENYKTELTGANDIEGLAAHPSGEGLILACKEQSNLVGVEKVKKTKCLYYFDLKDKKLQQKPFMSISDADLIETVNKSYGSTGLSKTAIRQLTSRIKSFSPSGVAYHPLDGSLYVISSVGKSMIVLSSDGQIENITFLDEKIHQQPEGLCFDSEGNMYISNEGRGLVAKIYQYKLQSSK